MKVPLEIRASNEYYKARRGWQRKTAKWLSRNFKPIKMRFASDEPPYDDITVDWVTCDGISFRTSWAMWGDDPEIHIQAHAKSGGLVEIQGIVDLGRLLEQGMVTVHD